MSVRDPSLTAMRAFEAAARLGSFKAAASELCVTPGAVSQQIKLLELDLGAKLFHRSVRSVALTGEGRALKPVLAQSFQSIRAALAEVRIRTDERLTICTSSSFMGKWLLPRIHRFQNLWPDIVIKLSIEELATPTQNGSVSVRFGRTVSEEVFFHHICEETMIPVASPQFLKQMKLVRPSDIASSNLLHISTNDELFCGRGWDAWFEMQGVTPKSNSPGIILENGSPDDAIEAAKNGLGLALVPEQLASADILSGRLVSPFRSGVRSGAFYFLCCPDREKRRTETVAFFDWVQKETGDFIGAHR